jgi:hypothetical protein
MLLGDAAIRGDSTCEFPPLSHSHYVITGRLNLPTYLVDYICIHVRCVDTSVSHDPIEFSDEYVPTSQSYKEMI